MLDKIKNSPKIKSGIIILIVCVLLFFLYKKYQNIVKKQTLEPIYIRKPLNAKKSSVHHNKLIPLPNDGIGYTTSVWLYIDDWDYKYGEWKHVMHKGDKNGNSVQPGIWLHPTQNQLHVRFDRKNRRQKYKFHKNKVYDSILDNNLSNKIEHTNLDKTKAWCDNNDTCHGFTFEGKNMGDNSYVKVAKFPSITDHNSLKNVNSNLVREAHSQGLQIGTMEKQYKYESMNPSRNDNMIKDTTLSNNINNVPLGRWFHLAVVVNSQSTEIYIDGSLKSTVTIKNDIKQNNGHLWVTQNGGFSGMINQLRYHNTSLNHHQIRQLYYYGPSPWMYPDLTNMINKYKDSVHVDFSVDVDMDDDDDDNANKKNKLEKNPKLDHCKLCKK
uniref:LamG-like jellyroll fold domain-containing protein n=1 Tax=viral metagenome TaxID=1070528 RepID=A0A6C0J0C7_9ZZZZ